MQKNPINGAGLPDSRLLQQLLMEAAEQELLPRYQHAVVQRKSDGSLVTDADLAIQHRLSMQLALHWPDIPLMGEEMTPQQQQELMATGCYWCLDPLDGTTNFTSGLPFFALSLALVKAGQVVIGLVYDPMRKELFRAVQGQGAWVNDHPLRLDETPGELKESIAMVDFKRLNAELTGHLAQFPPYRSQRNFGAIALEWCWMAMGRVHLYLHGGQNPWDYAAGRLIFSEAGGCYLVASTSMDKADMSLQPVPAVAAVSETLYRQWLAWLQQAGFVAAP
jgi:myo-inositol-1(or 4)-monophosphatase